MLERLLKRANLLTRLRGAWRHDADEELKLVRKELRQLTATVRNASAALDITWSHIAIQSDRS